MLTSFKLDGAPLVSLLHSLASICVVHSVQSGSGGELLVVQLTGLKGHYPQLTTMLATSKNVLFPGHNHHANTGTDDPLLCGARVIIKVSGHWYWWLAG